MRTAIALAALLMGTGCCRSKPITKHISTEASISHPVTKTGDVRIFTLPRPTNKLSTIVIGATDSEIEVFDADRNTLFFMESGVVTFKARNGKWTIESESK